MDWLLHLVPGRMPLPLAWMAAVAIVPVPLILLAGALAGTAWDQPIFFGLLLGSLTASMLIAAKRGRRWWLWGIFGSVAFFFTLTAIGPLVQPVTVALAVALAERATPPVPPVPLAHQEEAPAEFPEEGQDMDQPRVEERPAFESWPPPRQGPPSRPFRRHRPRRR